MKDLNVILSGFWLTEIEQKIFTTCLRYGTQTASWVARILGIPRTTTYVPIRKLLKQDLLICNKLTHSSVYTAISIEDLNVRLKARRKELGEQISKLNKIKETKELYQSFSQHSPMVRYYEWIEFVKSLHKKMTEVKTFCSIIDIDSAAKYAWYDIEKVMQISERIKWKNIRDIVIDWPIWQEYKKKVTTQV